MGLSSIIKNLFGPKNQKKEDKKKLSKDKKLKNIFEKYSTSKEELENYNNNLSNIILQILKNKATEYQKKEKWDLVREIKVDIFEVLKLQNSLKEALLTAFEICFLDINGANISDRPRDYEKYFPSPIFVTEIFNINKKLNIKQNDLKNMFIKHILQNYSNTLTIEPAEAWESLRKELFKIEKLKSCSNYQD